MVGSASLRSGASAAALRSPAISCSRGKHAPLTTFACLPCSVSPYVRAPALSRGRLPSGDLAIDAQSAQLPSALQHSRCWRSLDTAGFWLTRQGGYDMVDEFPIGTAAIEFLILCITEVIAWSLPTRHSAGWNAMESAYPNAKRDLAGRPQWAMSQEHWLPALGPSGPL